MDNEELTKRRFLDLARKAANAPYFVFTDFLGLMEQALFSTVKGELENVKYTLFGGADGAERVMVRFGDEEELGYSEDFPISLIKAEPVSLKYAEKLTHRDFLGSVLALGLERSKIGDIIIRDSVGYIFAHETVAQYIIESLSKIRHTDVRLSLSTALPEGELYRTERRRIAAQGERLDAVVAKLFSISREQSLTLFKKGLVFANGKCILNNSYIPKRSEIISVRGYGRFIYLGYESHTKKGKLNIELELFV